MTGINPYSIALDEFSAPSDITTLNVSTSAHGLCPKLDNTVTHFLNGQGGWTTPASGSPGGSSGQVQYNSSGSFAGFAGITVSASTPNVTVTAQNSSDTAMVLKGNGTYTGNFLETQPSGSTTLSARIKSDGSIWSKNATANSARFVLDGDGTDHGYLSFRGDPSGAGSFGASWNATWTATTLWCYSSAGFRLCLGTMGFGPSAANFAPKLTYYTTDSAWYVGPDTATSPAAIPINATGGSGSNVAGAALTLAGGKGTGTGAAGAVNIQTAPTGTTGSTLNSLVTAGQFDASKTAGETRFLLYDVDKGALSRVSVGAADSGGTGFKVLRVPN